jgi:tetratricopeptide (TPR) repeat protein
LTHLDDNEVERFVGGDLPPDERRRVVRHLLTGCRPCRSRLVALREVLFNADNLEEDARGVGSFSYDGALARAAAQARRYQSRHRKEREGLERALEVALRLAEEQSAEIFSPQILSLRSWTRVEALLRLSFEERYRDPQRMLLLALAARLSAEHLDARKLGPGLVADFQARAWAEVGNAYRVSEQFELAEAAMVHAQRLLEEGTGDLLLLARLADIKASLRSDQRRLGEALDLLEAVHDLYLQAGNLHLAGRALLSQGIISNYDGNSREAVQLLTKALQLIDSQQDPRLAASAKLSIVYAMADCGDFQEAGRLLLGSGLRQAFAADLSVC